MGGGEDRDLFEKLTAAYYQARARWTMGGGGGGGTPRKPRGRLLPGKGPLDDGGKDRVLPRSLCAAHDCQARARWTMGGGRMGYFEKAQIGRLLPGEGPLDDGGRGGCCERRSV